MFTNLQNKNNKKIYFHKYISDISQRLLTSVQIYMEFYQAKNKKHLKQFLQIYKSFQLKLTIYKSKNFVLNNLH